MAFNVAIGMLQFGKSSDSVFNFLCLIGFALGSWNLLQDSFHVNVKDYPQIYDTILTVATIVGAMCSSLGASFYLKYGKYNMILVMNVLICIGTGLCMIEIMPVIAAGRLIIGIAAGAFSVMCP